MELRQLRSFLTLAEEAHFTRAAARLHIAQPALSQQIRRLEDELGLALVDRTTRRVGLTEAGALLAERARAALAELDDAVAELGELAGVRSGHLVIGAMQSLGPFDLTILLAAFHERHPGVDLTVREEVSDRLLELVGADAIDLAFVSVSERVRDERLETQRLLTEPLVAMLAPGHRLARRARLRVADLRDEPFIAFREGAALRRILAAAAGEAGFEPQIAFETNEVERALALAARGLGVTIVPASDEHRAGPPVVAVPLHRPALARDVTLVWRRGRRQTPAARAFLALARTADRTGAPAPAASGQ